MDELVKTLRCCGSDDRCKGCPRENEKGKCYDDICIEAADAIEELQATVDGLTAQTNMVIEETEGRSVIKFEPKWIPVTERLPEEGGWYLANVFSLGVQWGEITTKDSEWIQLVFYHEGKFHKLTGSNAKVTHWMPLPEPPVDFPICTKASPASLGIYKKAEEGE